MPLNVYPYRFTNRYIRCTLIYGEVGRKKNRCFLSSGTCVSVTQLMLLYHVMQAVHLIQLFEWY